MEEQMLCKHKVGIQIPSVTFGTGDGSPAKWSGVRVSKPKPFESVGAWCKTLQNGSSVAQVVERAVYPSCRRFKSCLKHNKSDPLRWYTCGATVNMQPNNQNDHSTAMPVWLFLNSPSGGVHEFRRGERIITSQNLSEYFSDKNTACAELGCAFLKIVAVT